MKYLRQLGIIFGVTFLAEIVKFLIPLPVPAGLYGLLLMLAALGSGLIPLASVRETADFLVGLMQLMFVPAGVGLIASYSGFRNVLPQSLLLLALSTALVAGATGRVTQRLMKWK
ncbi:MAG: CidA/LrgA family protein [Clostridiales bacterium]|jgi:holin-like protein|nr:CidA/LrgA family protein [Clostridiales bacterium]